MLRSAGYEQHHDGTHQWMFLVSEMTIKYQKPARLNQQLVVETEIIAAKGARLHFRQRLIDDDQQYCQLDAQIVCIDSNSMKPIRIPQPIKKELLRAH